MSLRRSSHDEVWAKTLCSVCAREARMIVGEDKGCQCEPSPHFHWSVVSVVPEQRALDAEAAVERLKNWQRAYSKGRAGMVESADQDFARAEKAEARVSALVAAGNALAAEAWEASGHDMLNVAVQVWRAVVSEASEKGGS